MKLFVLFFAFALIQAAEPDPKVLSYKLPSQLKWTQEKSGIKQAILFGDPAKPGWYAILGKWEKGKMSHPHFHGSDRYITVISGTWWLGTGPKYDPAEHQARTGGDVRNALRQADSLRRREG